MSDDILEINIKEILGASILPLSQQLVLYIPNKDKKGNKIKQLSK